MASPRGSSGKVNRLTPLLRLVDWSDPRGDWIGRQDLQPRRLARGFPRRQRLRRGFHRLGLEDSDFVQRLLNAGDVGGRRAGPFRCFISGTRRRTAVGNAPISRASSRPSPPASFARRAASISIWRGPSPNGRAGIEHPRRRPGLGRRHGHGSEPLRHLEEAESRAQLSMCWRRAGLCRCCASCPRYARQSHCR